MSLADKASLLLIPTGYKSQKVYSIFPTDGVGDFDFSRSSSATRIAKNGLITTVATNVPRLEYPLIDGVVNGCPSLLLEPQSTNLVTYSEDLNNFSTSNINVTINPNQITSPSGNLADKVEENNVNGSHAMRRLTGISVTAAQDYTFSFFAKKDERSIVGISNTIGGAGKNAFIDIENGVILSSDFNDSSIDNYGNGWYKISLTDTATNTSDYDIRIYTSTQDGDFSHQGVVGYGFYIWGISVEQSSYSTSYIPTNGSTVTRSAETCNNSGDAATFNDSEGVLMADISGLVDADDYRMISINAGNSSNTLFVGLRNDTGNVYFFLISGGTTQATYISDVNATNTNVKLAVKYKENDVSFYVNGFELYTDNSATMISGLNQLEFNYGNPSESFPFYGNTKQLQYYDSALTDSELEQLTSWTSFTDMANGQQYSII